MNESDAADEPPPMRDGEAERKPPYKINWTLTRFEWLATEWPAVVCWGGFAVVLAVPLVIAIQHSLWWLFLLPVWLVLSRKGVGIGVFLIRGSQWNELTIASDGLISHAYRGQYPQYSHWMGFESHERTFVLWGADGRYRLVIPRRALTQVDHREIADRVRVDLTRLPVGAGADLPPGVRAWA